ncbi:hypothetical protein HK100_001554 [Physocladia obscura]|uniref:Heterokaryon incompatibility domain-containing protein n=1 Tax=Physocladia obscura TaxID=109957 RepID=A0AAD5SWL7_9FUNG|nr:hypothetical protein HK100_001554 [Physocladia obscura]
MSLFACCFGTLAQGRGISHSGDQLHEFLRKMVSPWRRFSGNYTVDTLRAMYADSETAYGLMQTAIATEAGSEQQWQAATRLNEYLLVMMLCNLPPLPAGVGKVVVDVDADAGVDVDVDADAGVDAGQLRAVAATTAALVVGMLDDATLGRRANAGLVALFDAACESDVAVSHVWGSPALVAPDERAAAANQWRAPQSFPPGAVCRGWTVGARFVRKFLVFLGDRVWMDAFCVPQCCPSHKAPYIERMYKNYLLARATVAVGDLKAGLPKSPRAAFLQLVAEGWFKRAWTVQELGIARDVWLVYDDRNGHRADSTQSSKSATESGTAGKDYQRARMFDVIHELLLEATGFNPPQNKPTIDKAELFWIAYSYRAIRASVFDLDPAQNVTALMQGRTAYHAEDMVYSLANLCGIEMKAEYSNENDEDSESRKLSRSLQAAQAWIQFANCASQQHSNIGLYATSCVPLKQKGLSAIPDIGYDIQPIWPRGRRMRILSGSNTGLNINSWTLNNILSTTAPIPTNPIGNSPRAVKDFINQVLEDGANSMIKSNSSIFLDAKAYAPWIGNCINDQQSRDGSRWQIVSFSPYMGSSISNDGGLTIILTFTPDVQTTICTVLLVLADEKSDLKAYTCLLVQQDTNDDVYNVVGHLWYFSHKTLAGNEKRLLVA